MKPQRWNAVKLRAKRSSYLGIHNKAACHALWVGAMSNTSWRDVLVNMQEEIYKIIDQWDIRRAKALCKLIPDLVPKSCTFTVDYDEKGEWIIF